MITITAGKITREFPNKLLPAICLELAGGGYTTEQTFKAMCYQSAMEEKGEVKTRKFHMMMSKEEP